MKLSRNTPQLVTSLNANSSMKIGFVLDDSLDRMAGTQQYILTLSQWLISQGHAVHYLVSTTNRTDLHNLHILGHNIPVHLNGNYLRIALPTTRRHIKRLLKRERFDILHVQLPYSPLLSGRVINASNRQTAIIGTFHMVPRSPGVSKATRILALLGILSLRKFDKIVSVSLPAQQFASKVFHLSSDVLPNVVNVQQFRSAKPLPLQYRRTLVDILFIGQLVSRKGCFVLLEAVLRMRKTYPTLSFMLTICGSGPLRQSLEKFVQQNGLKQLVRFTGYVTETEKLRIFASADIAVFPSTAGESFGIVLLEAMASGRPAILAGDNSGYRSVLRGCPVNNLFDPEDVQELVQKLIQLCYDEKLRKQIVQWQSQRVRDFDVEYIGPKLLTIYRSALQRRRNVQ